MCPQRFRYRKSFIKPPGGNFFPSTFEVVGGRGNLFNLVKCINGRKVSRERTCGYRGLYCFSKNKKMATILHRELERKVEKVQHMKLEVMRSKTTEKQYEFLA